MGINTRVNNESQKTGERTIMKFKNEQQQPPENNGINKPRQGWREKFSQKPRGESDRQAINSLVVERQTTGSKEGGRSATSRESGGL